MKISELNKHYNEIVEINGFVDNIRILQYVIFIILRDRSGKVQITIEKEGNEKLLNIIEGLTCESTISVSGKVLENSKVKLNGMEVIPDNIIVTSISNESLPFNYKNLDGVNLDTRLDYRFIDLRSEKNILMFEVQTCMINAMRDYCVDNDFIEIHTPKLIPTASESGSEVFEVKYFNDVAYLAQSPQFYKQMAIASGFERVFEIAPAFRAENSNTNRHATEFTSFDIEFSNINSYRDVMDFEEDLLIAGLTKVKEKYGDKIKEVFNKEVIIPKKPFPRVKLQDLYKELHELYNYNIPDSDVGDMNSESEGLAYKYAMEKYNHEFIFITDFAKTKRAFYHKRENDIPLGYDLIWRGTEITTGAERENRYEYICKQAKEKGLNKDVEFYLEFFKYGCPRHGGFAIGVDRLTMLLLGIPSVKEEMFLFRGPNRIKP